MNGSQQVKYATRGFLKCNQLDIFNICIFMEIFFSILTKIDTEMSLIKRKIDKDSFATRKKSF